MASPQHFRAHRRHRTNYPARLTLAPGVQVDAEVRDLGMGGACVALERDASRYDVVTLELESDLLWDTQRFQCRVVWGRHEDGGHAVGLAFDYTSPIGVQGLLTLLRG